MRQKHLTLAFTAIALSLCSCSKSIDEVIEPTEKRAVEIFTRTAPTVNIEYPVTLYAFKSTGELVENVTAEEEGDPLQLQLPIGSYKFTAIAGADGLSPVTPPDFYTGIGIPEDGLITSPIQMGHADLSIGATNTEVTITMTYQVAKVDVELYNIPTDATEVSITLSSLNADKAFNGAWSGENTVTIPLTQTEETTTWKSTTVYTLPGVASNPLTVGISVTAGDQTKVYSYTHTTNLKAGTPYTLKGSYDGEVNINGTIAAEGWNAPEEISFSFGAGSPNNGGSTPDNNGNNGNTPSELPAALSVWNNHFVMAVTTNDAQTEAELLLLALRDWEVSMSEIETKIAEYEEKGLTDWRIPTEEELKSLATLLGDASVLSSINSTLGTIYGDKFSTTKSEAYFCGDATRFVTMKTAATGNTSASSKYRLRLVKTVTVSVQ